MGIIFSILIPPSHIAGTEYTEFIAACLNTWEESLGVNSHKARITFCAVF